MEIQVVRDSFERALPMIRLSAAKRYRAKRFGNDREEFVAEVVALSWSAWLRCYGAGKDPETFVVTLVDYQCRAVRCGRRLAKTRARRDVTNPCAQQEEGFTVESLGHCTQPVSLERAADTLLDRKNHGPAETAIARIAFADWSRGLNGTRAAVVRRALDGYTTTEIAQLCGVSLGAVSQHRRAAHSSFSEYCDA